MSTRRSIPVLFVAAVLAVCLAACAPDDAPPEPGFQVRLLTSVAVSGRWERAAERGLGLIAAELEADVARVRAGGTQDQRVRFRELGRQGVELVFCIGPEVESLVYTEAGAFPETDFVVIPGGIHAANVASIAFMPEEAGYLAGAAAASVAARPSVGLLRGAGRPWLELLENGFVAGFRATFPNASVVTADGPTGPWQLAAAGVQIALYSTDRTDARTLAAAHDAGILLVGADPAVLATEPDLVIAAVDVDVAEAMLRVAREVDGRSFTGQVYAFDLGSGVLDVVVGSGLGSPEHDAALREAIERARSEITAGWVEIEELGIGN